MQRNCVWFCLACLLVGLMVGHFLTRSWLCSRQSSNAIPREELVLPKSGSTPVMNTRSSRSGVAADLSGIKQAPPGRPGEITVLQPESPKPVSSPSEAHYAQRLARSSPLPPEEEADLVRRLEANPTDKDVDPSELGGSTNPHVVGLLMKAIESYGKTTPSDLFLFRAIDGLEAIYQRTHQLEIGGFLRRRYYDLDEVAKRFVLDDYPYAEELVPILRDALVDPKEPFLRYMAAHRIEQEPSIWPQLQSDVYARADTDEDDQARHELQLLRNSMQGH